MAPSHLKVGNTRGSQFFKLGNMMTLLLGNARDPRLFLAGELWWPLTTFN